MAGVPGFVLGVGSAAVTNVIRRKSRTSMRAAALQLVKPEPVDEIRSTPESGELGVDGGGNYGGNLWYETNPELRNVSGYGRAGSLEWGVWENIGRTNPFVSMGVDFVMAPIRDARVEVEPADESPLAQEQSDFVLWALTENLEPGWPDLLQQMGRNSLITGFSLHELVWEPVEHESLPGGTALTIVEFAERLASTVSFNAWQENKLTGQLEFIRQQGPRGSEFKTVDLPVEKVLLNTWNRNGKNYAGYSAFRTVQYICRIIEKLIKLTGIALVREGAGIPVAFCTDPKTKLSKPQRHSFQKLLANLVFHENASAVLPSGWDIKWTFSPGANKGHVVDTINSLGQLVLMQVGAQQLSLGISGTGSRSVGQVHSAEADSVRQGVIANIEAGFNGVGRRRYTGPIRKMVDAVWGRPKSGKYPRLKIILRKPKLTPAELAKALVDGKTAGVFTPTLDDENDFRESAGLAPIDEKTREAEKQKARDLAPPAFPVPGQQPGNPFGGKPAQASALRAAFMPARPLRESEKSINFTGMAALFDRGPEDFSNGVRPLVLEMLAKALPELKVAMKSDPSSVGDIKLDTTRLDAFVGKYLEQLRAAGYREVKAEMRRALPLRAAAEEDDKYGPDGEATAADDAQAVLAPVRKHLVKRMGQRLSSDLEKAAIDVSRTGGEPEEALSRTLEAQVGSGAFKGDAAIVTTKALNVGRQEFADENAEQIESAELSAAMDTNTCGPCDRLDGTEFDFGSDEEVEHTPPLSGICDGGDRCRCIKIFNFKRSEVPAAGDEE